MKLFFAPLQGYTDAAYRKFHNEVFEGCIECYYTPFLRIERGAVREKEIRDILPINNKGIKIVPQIIVKDTSEFRMLVDLIISLGYNEIDINMGCPFPMQIKRGRGAALLKKTQIETLLQVRHINQEVVIQKMFQQYYMLCGDYQIQLIIIVVQMEVKVLTLFLHILVIVQ